MAKNAFHILIRYQLACDFTENSALLCSSVLCEATTGYNCIYLLVKTSISLDCVISICFSKNENDKFHSTELILKINCERRM